jgi:hypothetical protein
MENKHFCSILETLETWLRELFVWTCVPTSKEVAAVLKATD